MSISELFKKLDEFPGEIIWGALGTVGTLLVLAFTAGWGLRAALSGTALKDALARCSLSDQRVDTAETDLEKLKLTFIRANDRIQELALENASLHEQIKLLVIQGTDGKEQAKIIGDLRLRVDKFDKLKDALFGSEEDLWNLRVAEPPANFEARMRESRVRIVTVANLKGGVGKTTIAANLAAHFSLARNKRVLLIDFDYQGSLTRTMSLGAKVSLGSSILADALLGGDVDGKWLANFPKDLGARLPGMRLITCGPTFDGFESRMLLRWLLGEAPGDIRYRLANLVLSPEVQEDFDLIIVDAPPRLSLGTVNALCASHALLVPTVPDRLSVDAVGRFLRRANVFRSLNSALLKIGIVASLTEQVLLKPHEQEAMDAATNALELWHGPGQVLETNIRHFTALGKAAGKEIGYLEDRQVRTAFDLLGTEVGNQWQV